MSEFQVPNFIAPFQEGKTAGECYRALFQYLFDLGRINPTNEQKQQVFDAGMALIATITKDYALHAILTLTGLAGQGVPLAAEVPHD